MDGCGWASSFLYRSLGGLWDWVWRLVWSQARLRLPLCFPQMAGTQKFHWVYSLVTLTAASFFCPTWPQTVLPCFHSQGSPWSETRTGFLEASQKIRETRQLPPFSFTSGGPGKSSPSDIVLTWGKDKNDAVEVRPFFLPFYFSFQSVLKTMRMS
jgi:hypothetical protein